VYLSGCESRPLCAVTVILSVFPSGLSVKTLSRLPSSATKLWRRASFSHVVLTSSTSPSSRVDRVALPVARVTIDVRAFVVIVTSSPRAATLPAACACSARHEDQYVSLEIERHPEFAKEVQAQKAVNRCAEWFEVGEIHDAGSELVSPSGAYADRIHPDELQATGSFHTGPDSDHAASGWQPETLDEFPVHTGHRRPGIENEIPGTLSVHVNRDGEGGIIGAHEGHGDLSGDRIRRGFHLHPLVEGTPVQHEDQGEDSHARDASDFAHTKLGLQLSIPPR
jgi:hypothetical protein